MMKRLIFCTAFLSVFAASAQTNIVLETLYENGTTNAWSQADLKDALGLMNRKYHRDMKTESGRRAWHGEKLNQYLLTNDTTKIIYMVTLYADGYTHTALSKPVRPKDPEAALKAKLEAAGRAEAVRAAWERANLPPEIAALRQAQRDAAETNTITVKMEQ